MNFEDLTEDVQQWLLYTKKKKLSNESLYSALNNAKQSIYQNIPGSTFIKRLEFVKAFCDEEEINMESKEKQKINLVFANGVESEYLEYLNTIFDVTVLKPEKLNQTYKKSQVDLVLFTGGADVSPEYYKENLGNQTYINANRDEIECDIFYKFKGCKMLGICRGAQLLTVLNGGKLVQHINNHGRTHSIQFQNGNTVDMTSTHHQMMWPFDLNKKNYSIVAHSTYHQSNTYLNGDNKEIDLPQDFVEPEIVFYPNTTCLCIQGHPEYSTCSKQAKDLCSSTIKKCLFNNKQTSSKEVSFIDEQYEHQDIGIKIADPYYGFDSVVTQNRYGIERSYSSTTEKVSDKKSVYKSSVEVYKDYLMKDFKDEIYNSTLSIDNDTLHEDEELPIDPL